MDSGFCKLFRLTCMGTSACRHLSDVFLIYLLMFVNLSSSSFGSVRVGEAIRELYRSLGALMSMLRLSFRPGFLCRRIDI